MWVKNPHTTVWHRRFNNGLVCNSVVPASVLSGDEGHEDPPKNGLICCVCGETNSSTDDEDDDPWRAVAAAVAGAVRGGTIRMGEMWKYRSSS